MAKKKKGSSDKKGKKAHKNKPTSKKYALYSGEKKAKHCPRCGPGVFLGGGLGRLHCGKCHYTEFIGKE
jgi:ubiquitin-small subunit ribosomal protein S27Ae